MNEQISIVINNYPEEVKINKKCNTEEIDKIEKILKAKLPKSYREFLLNTGGGMFFGEYIAGVETGISLDECTLLAFSKEYQECNLPKGLVVIQDELEFTYCLNTNSFRNEEECPIVIWVPYQRLFTKRYDSFEEFLLDGVRNSINNL